MSTDHREAIMLLNELLALDPHAVSALALHRVPCSALLVSRGGLRAQRDYETGRYSASLLDLLNTLLAERGRVMIAAMVTETGTVEAFDEVPSP